MSQQKHDMDGKNVVRDAAYHDAHLQDPEEWDEQSAQTVQPKPSGMVVFSLRLPGEEFNLLKQEADRRSTTMSELTRTALRGYLQPRVYVSLSWAAEIRELRIFTNTDAWVGGVGWSGETTPLQVPAPQSAQGLLSL